jgi:hypothetical protein
VKYSKGGCLAFLLEPRCAARDPKPEIDTEKDERTEIDREMRFQERDDIDISCSNTRRLGYIVFQAFVPLLLFALACVVFSTKFFLASLSSDEITG